MRLPAARHTPRRELVRALDRLDGLPLRPLTAISVVDAFPESGGDSESSSPVLPKFLESDPGWVVLGPTSDESANALGRIATRSWWRASSPVAIEALERLWKHAVATSGAARRLAQDSGRTDLDRFARAGLLQSLGLWAVAAIDPDLLAEFLSIADSSRRSEAERAAFGRDLAAVGRDLAARWDLEPLVGASCWLHADGSADLNGLGDDPEALALLQQAYVWAERTPWALYPRLVAEAGPTDPRHRILVAEVQVRCGVGLLDPDSTPREESLTRRLASLRIQSDSAKADLASRDRVLGAIAESEPYESRLQWAARASRVWCEEPGIASAKVVWPSEPSHEETIVARPPARTIRLGASTAQVLLWHESEVTALSPRIEAMVPAWTAWAEAIAERDRRGDRLDHAVSAHRSRVAREAVADREARLSALGEFAAGAGHELNNPLAVILGRAQLLLPRMEDPDDLRSLRTIIGQAQRAHRILRDLMYVARPPAARPRLCRPDEILKLAVRDLRTEAEARGIKLSIETREPVPVTSADPDMIRHLLDVLLRNALESTPAGGSVRVTSGRTGDRLTWIVRDTGKGITLEEGRHLFEPFFCGRQAGRGLGLGLPRAARALSLAGGELTWRSTSGHGSVFAAQLPSPGPDTSFVV